MNELYLVPTSSVAPRDPVTGQPLPDEGAHKPRTSYWLRRLREGSVKEGRPPKPGRNKSEGAAKSTTADKGDDK